MSSQFLTCKHILFVGIIIIYSLESSTSTDISPDSKRLYHDIVSGHGLYYGFTKLTEMGGSNFKSVVFKEEKNKLWLVEFYNSWCGHCHRFAPTWKALASDVYEWRDVIGIGAVDCANDDNNQLCRDLEVMYYPMIKLFPPNSDETFLGEDFQKGTIEEMRNNVIKKVKTYQSGIEKIDGVNLKPLSNSGLNSLWSDVPPSVQFLALVFEPEESTIGAATALDLSRTKELQVRSVNPANEQLAEAVQLEQGTNAVVIVERDLKFADLHVDSLTRVETNKAVRQFLISRGVDVPLDLPSREVIVAPEVNIADIMHIMQLEDEIKKKLQTTALSTVVFQLDLEGAIRYSLKNEVPLHRNISGDHLIALNNYMEVLIKYFPFGQQGVNFLKKLKKVTLEDKTEVSGKAFRQSFLQLEEEFKPFLKKQGWIGCRGSQPEYRGYPCSLWTLFHTLTIHEELRDRNTTDYRPDVIYAMAGYIKNYFTCSECAGHFTEMAQTIAGNVTTQNDSIWWLWSAHNRVNARLAGDQTEDPQHKKLQFPDEESCPKCRLTDGSWNKSEVMSFLINMYSNVIYLQEDDLSTTTTTTTAPPSTAAVTPQYNRNLRHQVYGDEGGFKRAETNKPGLWGFNLFDISICVVLYVCSVAILILVCIKFVFKRSYRKKPYIHDILSKV